MVPGNFGKTRLIHIIILSDNLQTGLFISDMTIQAVVFILLVSAFYGCLFHLIFGGNVFSIFVNILIAAVGFFAGNFVGNVIGRELIRIGVINFGWGSATSFVFLLIGTAISHPLF